MERSQVEILQDKLKEANRQVHFWMMEYNIEARKNSKIEKKYNKQSVIRSQEATIAKLSREIEDLSNRNNDLRKRIRSTEKWGQAEGTIKLYQAQAKSLESELES